MRDPRIDPMRRDAFRRVVFGVLYKSKSVTRITIEEVAGEQVFFRQRGFGKQRFSMTLVEFRRWAAGAEVVRVAGETE